MGPNINNLLTCISNWVNVKDQLTKSQFFIDIVTLTYKFFSLVQANKFSAQNGGFELRSLTKLFDVKSTAKKDKSFYQIILKQYLIRKDPKASQSLLQAKNLVAFWKQIPLNVFDDSLIAQAKVLYPPAKLMSQLNQMMETREQLEQKVQLFS